jgi:RNA recognition motif-containing protein
MNIFIGNLSYNVTEEDLHQTFEAFGQVASATVIEDKQSGRSNRIAILALIQGRHPRQILYGI